MLARRFLFLLFVSLCAPSWCYGYIYLESGLASLIIGTGPGVSIVPCQQLTDIYGNSYCQGGGGGSIVVVDPDFTSPNYYVVFGGPAGTLLPQSFDQYNYSDYVDNGELDPVAQTSNTVTFSFSGFDYDANVEDELYEMSCFVSVDPAPPPVVPPPAVSTPPSVYADSIFPVMTVTGVNTLDAWFSLSVYFGLAVFPAAAIFKLFNQRRSGPWF